MAGICEPMIGVFSGDKGILQIRALQTIAMLETVIGLTDRGFIHHDVY
jgi:hypothetical protein